MNVDRRIDVTFCDDVRQEVGNKLTLVGCYNVDMILDRLPIVLPKFCAHIRIWTPIERPFGSLNLRLKQDEDVLAEHSVPLEHLVFQKPERLNDATHFTAAAVLCVSPFAIESPCKLRIEAVADGESLVTLPFRLRLRDAPTPKD